MTVGDRAILAVAQTIVCATEVRVSRNKALRRAKSCCQIVIKGNRIGRHLPCYSATPVFRRPLIRTPPPRSVPSRRPAVHEYTRRGFPADVGIALNYTAFSTTCAKA